MGSVNSRGDKKDQDSSHTGQCHFQKVKLVVGTSLAPAAPQDTGQVAPAISLVSTLSTPKLCRCHANDKTHCSQGHM